MDYLNKVGEVVTMAAKDLTSKTKEVADVTKIRLRIREKEADIEELYRELGKKYYEEHHGREESAFIEVAKITAAIEELHEIQEELAEAKGKRRCANCGKPMGRKDQFCPSCGTKSEEEDPMEDIFDDEEKDVIDVEVEEAKADGAQAEKTAAEAEEKAEETTQEQSADEEE